MPRSSNRIALSDPSFAVCLPGEDRAFGGNQFYVDTLPPSAWYANLRTSMAQYDWKCLSAYVRERAGQACEICGSPLRPEAHERWSFDPASGVQKLERLVCLCKLCHLGTHWGVTGALGFNDDVKSHVLAVTGWTSVEFSAHVKERRDRAKALPRLGWTLDVGMMTAVGISLLAPEQRAQAAAKQEAAVRLSQRRASIDDGHGGRRPLVDEIRRGLVVFAPSTDEEMLGSTPLGMTRYCAKEPGGLPAGTITLPLPVFIEAHNNPVAVRSGGELQLRLRAGAAPRRLVVGAGVDISGVDLAKALGLGILVD